MNRTTDPSLKSWVSVPAGSDFPIQNLPYGMFVRQSATPHAGVAIGEQILDLTEAEKAGLFHGTEIEGKSVFAGSDLNRFAALGKSAWKSVRAQISELLRHDYPTLRDNPTLRAQLLVAQSDVVMQLPVTVGDYTDFYSSIDHARNVGTMLRGAENALMPNWLHLPVAYHGRASSLVVDGTNVVRPRGQSKPEGATTPVFGPSRTMDFELETAIIIGPGNPQGEPIAVDRAEDHIFGIVLLNDWSARDIQAWEYQPLGPFLSKNFATSVSPWVVTLEALEPFRCDLPTQEPAPLPYLNQSPNRATFDVALQVDLTPAGGTPTRITQSNFKYLYWSLAQQIAHHTVNGCALRTGDLLGSGTISGPTPESRGCLLERTWRGSQPLTLEGGATRTFLQDGDRVTMSGHCEANGVRLGFGSVSGTVLPARG